MCLGSRSVKPSREQLTAGLAAAYRLKDHGPGPGNGRDPVSFTRDPGLYVEAIAEAVLALVPEPRKSRKEK